MKPAHRVLVDCQALLRRWPSEDELEQFKGQIAFQQLLCSLFERLQRIARVLGKEAEASQWLERYEAKKQTVSKRLRPLVSPGTTVAVLRIDNGKVWVHAPRFFPSTRCSDFPLQACW
ncbi:ABC transporter substrate-binding protein [Brevibacillus agri]|uniref:ABC transporter substrate-binding protein n=1 Tax=Brevibacillus agri TaxID=51101 RepID=UPI000471ADDE|nr:ABC transporter substrate-binding protein [Brevibacillus agri]MED1644986.1 ABC transporter substrate-binding protein [Brevibacillus agri]MED1653978.1 ABC transporter substrate-binding protein [Brevibacillus agri]MED1685528.1 ABC transporter substrate-binding protein [Brevibacillus agri]MED1692763.1 ABC transporter substrate-binding protein [Brevibacillus agri]MED1697157.1 ABC transporter substrate-binding protein [Brevibacillus agri]